MIDDIMAGKRVDDIKADAEAKAKEVKKRQEALLKPKMEAIEEEKRGLDLMSNADSRVSKNIEQIVEAKAKDPRKKMAGKKGAKGQAEAPATQATSLNAENLSKLAESKQINEMFYRQPEVALPLDQSLDRFLKEVSKALYDEIRNSPKPVGIDTYVDRYAKSTAEFLNYEEFKEVYITHVQPNLKNKTYEEGKVLALFNLLDGHGRGKISRRDFVMTMSKFKPAVPFMERLIARIRRGGERFERVIRQEFIEADAPTGLDGLVPIKVF